MNRALSLFSIPLVFALTGCPKEGELTAAEARESLEQASDSSQADSLAGASIDLSTHFTLGGALESAADELHAFVTSQLPCAEVTLEGATLDIEYGVKPGHCTYHGHTFSGASTITFRKNAPSEVLVEHTWRQFSNGVIALDGSAQVSWRADEPIRHVVHDVQWTHLATGRTGRGSGDRTQAALSGGVLEGIQVDGSRSWSGPRGTWDLAIDGVQMRWSDPVPQAGRYTLHTPFDKNVSMSFSRVDDDTIEVSVAGSKRGFSFTVSKAGAIASK